MLACFVSQLAAKRTIAADLDEAAQALDAATQGFALFATLVDDPAAVDETVDAYFGEIMVEAASASDDLSSGGAFDGAITEAATATDAMDFVLPPATWNPSDIIRATLSNGNLTVTTTASNNGCTRATGGGKSAGKYYFEYTPNVSNQGTDFYGLANPSLTLPIVTNTADTVGIDGLLRVWVGTSTAFGGSSLGGTLTSIFFAVDLTANLFWVKPSGGDWNGSSSNDPATGVGGLSISGLTKPLVPFAKPVLSGANTTANFGASSFSGSVPSGFTAGWPG